MWVEIKHGIYFNEAQSRDRLKIKTTSAFDTVKNAELIRQWSANNITNERYVVVSVYSAIDYTFDYYCCYMYS